MRTFVLITMVPLIAAISQKRLSKRGFKDEILARASPGSEASRPARRLGGKETADTRLAAG